jgi:hypothetical protein
MKSHRRMTRRLRTLLIALAACTALAAPAAAEPGNDYPQPASDKIGDTPADFGKPVVPPAPPLDEASDTGGFDWPSAAIGAGGAGVVMVVSAGGMALASRRRIRVAR